MSCDDCLSRRAFLAKSGIAVAGVAALAAGCGDGQFGPAALSTTSNAIEIKVGLFPALATVGQLVKVPREVGFLAVKRTALNPPTFTAISTVCTHQGTEVDIKGNLFECSNHLSRFDNNGLLIRGPSDGGSATNLPIFPTKYNASTDILTIG